MESNAASATLSVGLKNIVQKYSDVRSISIHSIDCIELIQESRIDVANYDSSIVNQAIQLLPIAVEKSTLLGLGDHKHNISWIGNLILLQTMVHSLIISITVEDDANIPMMQDVLKSLKSSLAPYSQNINTSE